jgi:hypothetical protein
VSVERSSLLQRALGVFIVLALCLGVFLWAGKKLIQRPVESTYLDSRRLAALQTFERAIVPRRTLRGYIEPTAESIRAQFAFCADPLKEKPRERATSRRPSNPCAGGGASEELACNLRTIDERMADMTSERRKGRERTLGERYVVDVERWVEAIRAKKTPCRDAAAAARQLAARDGRLLRLVAWRDLAPRAAASQFSADQPLRISGRIFEQRNPWGGVPGCIYYGDASTAGGKILFVTDRRQSNRQACFAMRPRDVDEKAMLGVVPQLATEQRDRKSLAAEPPESLEVILADLDNVRLPWRDLYRAYTEKPSEPAGEARADAASDAHPVAQAHGPNQLDRQKHKVDAASTCI